MFFSLRPEKSLTRYLGTLTHKSPFKFSLNWEMVKDGREKCYGVSEVNDLEKGEMAAMNFAAEFFMEMICKSKCLEPLGEWVLLHFSGVKWVETLETHQMKQRQNKLSESI